MAEGPWCQEQDHGVVLAFNVDQPTASLRRGDIVATVLVAQQPQQQGELSPSVAQQQQGRSLPSHAHVLVDDRGLERMLELELPPEEYYEQL